MKLGFSRHELEEMTPGDITLICCLLEYMDRRMREK